MQVSQTRIIALKKLNKYYKIFNKKLMLIEDKLPLEQRDLALINEIVTGVIRWQLKIDFILDKILSQGVKKTDAELVNILRIGVYQLLFMSKIPNYAILNDAVELAKIVNSQKYAPRLVNRVLREFLRQPEIVKVPQNQGNRVEYLSLEYSHRKDLVQHWYNIFGDEETERLLAKNNERASLTFRVNSLLASNEEVKEYLKNHNIEYLQNEYYPNIFVIQKNLQSLENNTLFQSGKITIQDTSAIVSTMLLAPLKDSFVIDMCASPGGKSCYLAEMMANTGRILANDISKVRTNLIAENVERLKVKNIEISMANALELPEEIKSDSILLDAPCTGLGIIRKLPEIKYLNREKTLKQTIKLQRALLEKAAKLVKNNGTIVYSTCSIEPSENIENVQWFLKYNPQFSLEVADNYVNPTFCKDGCVQIFPHIHNCNGAFAARLKKVTN